MAMLFQDAYERIPERHQQELARYVQRGIPVGGFIQAVLENDLVLAATLADSENRGLLAEYAKVLVKMPAEAWGTRAAISAWIQKGGLEGMKGAEVHNYGD